MNVYRTSFVPGYVKKYPFLSTFKVEHKHIMRSVNVISTKRFFSNKQIKNPEYE